MLIYLVVNVFVVVVVYESVCLSLVWCDRVRCGVAWFDVLWFCVVCGVVCVTSLKKGIRSLDCPEMKPVFIIFLSFITISF